MLLTASLEQTRLVTRYIQVADWKEGGLGQAWGLSESLAKCCHFSGLAKCESLERVCRTVSE